MKNKKLYLTSILVCLAISALIPLTLVIRHGHLEQIRNEALERLERDRGSYDESSIILYDTSRAKAEKMAERFDAGLRITKDGSFATLTLPEGVTIIDIYADEDNLRYVDDMEADYQVRISSEEETVGERLPTSPTYPVSDISIGLQTYLDYLNLQDVWGSYRGNGITVAVIDTGIDTDHPEFAGRISEYSYNATEDKIVKDYLLETGDYDWSLVEDEQGHGTAVAGVVAANMNSGDVIGIAPDVNVIVIKAECDERGVFERTSDLVFGLYYAIERDAQVVNMSFGTIFDVFADAVQLAYDSDVICVAAAGNEGSSGLVYPAAYDKVIGVGALAEDSWELAVYSNYGENTQLVAPGTTYTTQMGGGYATVSGTSLSAPQVTAAIALYMQTDSYATFDEVTEILYASCYDLGDLGCDWDYGFGALDVNAFLIEDRCTVTYEMLTDELDNEEGIFIKGHALQEYPEPERLYAVFDGWYYDDTLTQAVEYYSDAFEGDITLYAKWVNEDDGIPYTYVILDDGTVEIRSYTGHRRFITIPDEIEGRTVSSIGDFAFKGQTRLREIGLPSGLNNIGMCAFANCSNLTAIEIPEGVVTIGEKAFAEASRLRTVAFLGESCLETVGNGAFAYCGKLAKLDIPASVSYLNATAVYGATGLESINVDADNQSFSSIDGVMFNAAKDTLYIYPAAHGTTYEIPEGITSIGDMAFAFAGVTEIELDGIVSLGKQAFEYSSLKALTLPDSVTSMGSAAFTGCFGLASVTLGEGLTAVADNAFELCTALDSITIPDQITAIGDGVFFGSGLTSVVFEEGSALSSIGSTAFARCGIAKIKIPASVLSIGNCAFSANLRLSELSFEEGSLLESIGDGAFDSCITLSSPVLPDTLKYIGDEAFSSCVSITEIILPDGLVSIGGRAFANTSLNTVTLPSRLTSLGGGAFSYCSSLAAVEVADGNTVYHDIDGVVYTLDNATLIQYPTGNTGTSYTVNADTTDVAPYSFAGTVYLESVTLPEGLEVLGKYSFCGAGIVNISLPGTLTEIQQCAFYSCTKLSTLNIPDSVVQIGKYSVAGCKSLKSVNFGTASKLPRISYGAFAYSGIQSFTVPANVSTIAQGAFMGCDKLTSVTFAENSLLGSVSAYMFDGCTNLNSITFENGTALTSIQAHGFEGLSKLTNIDFGDAELANADNFAFRFCESLEELSLPDTLISIGRYAFYACKSLSELTVPVNVEHIGSYAFLGTNELDLYLASDNMPQYLDENWDHGIAGYYTGVTAVYTEGDYKYATMIDGNVAIIEYLGTETVIDLTTVDLGAPITTIGGKAFKDKGITAITLPDTLTEIQAEAFTYDPLGGIVIPKGVTFIGREAFAHTDIASLTFEEGSAIRVIEQYAFERTESLAEVYLPKSLEILGSGVFSESGLKNVVFEEGIALEEIPQRAFAETLLEEIALPDSVILVNHNAFNNVQTLKTVTFGENEGIRLMSNAFYHTGLESLHIPANVTYIGEYCFVALNSLTEFSVDADNPNYAATDGLLVNKSGGKLIAVPAGRMGSLTVPEGIEEIGFGAFEETKLSEILFSENANILTFGYRAFFKAENITSISIPKSVVSVDYYAFAYCEKLEDITFADGCALKGIYEGAFAGDIALKNITLPDSIVEISDFAFYGCSCIDKLPVGGNSALKGVYDYSFAYTGIKGEFTLPDSLIDIGNYAFLGTKVTNVTVPDTNQKELIIGIGAFRDCNKLEEITLPFIGGDLNSFDTGWFGYIFGAGSWEANAAYVPDSLKTVTIYDGPTFLGYGAFAELDSIETINMPSTIETVYSYAMKDTVAKYEYCGPIFTVGCSENYGVYGNSAEVEHFGKGICGRLTLAEGVTGISSAFMNCAWLTEVSIPSSVTSIEYGSFANCTGLTVITVPDGVTSIGSYAFQDCTALTEITIPDSVTYIGDYAFKGCTGLTEIIIPDSVTDIKWSVFFGCTGLKDVVIGNSVTNIGQYAFCDCTGLTKIVIPDCVTDIENGAFQGCTSLEDVAIGSGLTGIGSSNFRDCTALREITIPSNITYIDSYAFGGCSNLYVVYNNSDIELVIGDSNNGNVSTYAKKIIDKAGNTTYRTDSSGVVYIETVEGFLFEEFDGAYKLIAYLGSEDTVTLPADINGEAYTIYQFNGAKHITIPSNITSIDDYAFKRSTTLKSINIPDSVTSIGSYAFQDCTALTEITIPDSIKSIGGEAFDGCTGLAEISIPDSVTGIGRYAFQDCTELTSVSIGDGVTSLEDMTFYGCRKLKNITIGSGISTVKSRVFDGCDTLQYVFIESMEKWCTVDFEYSDSNPLNNGADLYLNGVLVDELVIPDGMISIAPYAFYGYEGLKKITIPNSVATIREYAFFNCNGVEEMIIPNSVITIGMNALPKTAKLILSEDNENFIVKDGVLYDLYFMEIVQLQNYASSVTILDGVTSIADRTFKDCTGLEEMILPSSVTYIGEHAFSGCTALKKITIPDSVTDIGYSAFSGCTELTEITIPDSVTSIGSSAFRGCTGLTEITIPDSVTSIADSAFWGCTGLTKIIIPDGVTYIGGSAFRDCTGLTEITIPDAVTSIGDSAFFGCTGLAKVTISDGVTSIGFNTFYGCISLAEITIPDSVTSIGESAFYGCTGLIGVIIGNSVKSIESYAFSGCTSITEITISDSVTSIGHSAFYNCTALTKITIPDSVTSIGYNAFHSCTGLTEITIPNSVTSIGGGAFAYCAGLVTITIPDSVTSIEDSTFYSCTGLTKITISGNITSIGYNAFSGCANLVEIIIPGSVTNIEAYAFQGCIGLMEISIPESVISIGSDAFSGCQRLYVVYNNSDLELTIGSEENGCVAYYARMIVDAEGNKTYRDESSGFMYIDTEDDFRFMYESGVYTLIAYLGSDETVTLPTDINGEEYSIYYFRGAKYVIIPNGIKSIGWYAFHGCTSLAKITVPDSVTSIGSYAFYDCTGLTEITIPDSVTSIGYDAFRCCTGLAKVVIPDSVTIISDYTFADCKGLTEIIIPDSVYYISDGAFAWCYSLTNIVIPNGVTSIRNSTFSNCISLKTITIPDSVTSIGNYAFEGCTSLAEITIPDSVKSIGEKAFNNTGMYNELSNWKDGMLIIDGWLIKASEEARYIDGIRSLRGAAYGAYKDCYLLQNAVWHGGYDGATNIETVVVPHMISVGITALSTMKNVVLLDSVDITDPGNYPNFFKNVTGITIFVEALEDDLLWDDIFPGWNNGSRVVYGDKWTWANFYDSDRTLLRTEPRLNPQVILRPVIEDYEEDGYVYEFLGWDVDSDGECDSVPATAISNVNATAVYKTTQRCVIYGHTYGEWYESKAPSCTEKGEERRDCEYCDAYETCDMAANGHSYESIVIAPTCIAQGYTNHTCSACGDNYIDSYIDAIGHTYDPIITAPTCTDQGYTTHTCSACGDSYIDSYVDAIGHTYGEWYESKAPSCTEKGEERRDCEYCDAYETRDIAANGHSYESIVIAPTCIAQGYNNHTCSACGDSYIDSYVDIIDHNYGEWYVTVPSMCSEEGEERRNCQYCGAYETRKTEASGHKYSICLDSPTCTEQGYTTYTCYVCGYTYKDSYVNATGHNYCGWYVVVNPTCTEKGEERRDCAYCDVYETRDMAANGHSYESTVTAPTCTDQGYTTHTCSACGDSYIDSYVDATGHTYDLIVTAPTCTDRGYTTHTCTACGDSYIDFYVDATGHTYDLIVTAPTCTDRGYTTHTCTACGDSYIDSYVDATGHTYGEWYEGKAPTCTENGEERRDCEYCDAYETRETATNGHSYESTVTAPTCTEQGYTTHTCSACGDSYIDSYVDATGHTYGEWYESIAPTCTEKGEERRDCECCDAYETRETAANVHSYELTVSAPTCTEQGYTTHTCSACGDSYIDSYVEATGHTYGEWYESIAPTCTEKGEERRDCEYCDAYETRETATNGHSYESTVTAPTCTEQGYTTHTCSACGDSYIDSYVDATGHTYDQIINAPTCTEQGYTTHTCSACGNSYIDSYVDVTGHTYGKWVETKAPTCTEQGEERRDCAYCDAYETRETAANDHNYVSAVTLPTTSSEGYTTHTCAVCGHSYTDNHVPKLEYVLGDVMNDGTVTSDDAIYLLKHTLFPDMYPIDQPSDFDGNGTLDSDDAIYLLKHTLFPDMYPLNDAAVAMVYALPPERTETSSKEESETK